MPKIAIVDTLYPEVIQRLPVDPQKSYEENLADILAFGFGTANFYSRNLKAQGWEAIDIIANHEDLQFLWGDDYNPRWIYARGEHLAAQIAYYKPDVVFSQDLSLPIPRGDYLLAGQHSCPWAGDENVRKYDCLFSSFPHYIPRIEALGVKAVYNPLAFEPSIHEHMPAYLYHWSSKRIHDCVFIGGVGNPSHWHKGMQVLEEVAKAIPTFKWWGYGVDTLPMDSALRRCYQGQAFGREMYEILLKSKICLNRHGEVAEGFANNMRMYEATGCGAMLLTDNRTDLFSEDEIARYESPSHAAEMARFYLDAGSIRDDIARAGQRRTLRDHTYAKRMKVVSDTLQEMLCPA